MTCTKSGRRHFKLSPGCQKKTQGGRKIQGLRHFAWREWEGHGPEIFIRFETLELFLDAPKGSDNIEMTLKSGAIFVFKIWFIWFLSFRFWDTNGGNVPFVFFKLNFLEVTLWVSNRVYRLLEDFITTSWFCRYSFGDSQGPVLHLFLIHWLKIFAYWQQVRRFTKMWLEKPWPQIFGWGFIR